MVTLGEYIRARSLLLYPYMFVAGPNKHDPFIELVTKRKFQHSVLSRHFSYCLYVANAFYCLGH